MPRSGSPPWTPDQLSARASIAARSRYSADDPTLEEQRRELRASRLASYVEMVVEAAPPLSQAQRDRVAAALGRAPAPNVEHDAARTA